MFIYFLNYFLLLLASSVLTCGFFMVTRGSREIMPDGSIVERGALLRSYYFFWFRERPEPIEWRYSGDELASFFKVIKASVPHDVMVVLTKTVIMIGPNPADCVVGNTFTTDVKFIEYIPTLRKDLGSKFSIISIKEGVFEIAVYREEPDYVFSEHVRKMMAGCITCFSSLYGTIIFLCANALFDRELLISSLYGFFGDTPTVVALPFTWAAYCVSLAYLNTFLWNKLK